MKSAPFLPLTSKDGVTTLDSADSSTRRIKFICGLLALGITWDFSSSLLGAGWIAASVITVIVLLSYIAYAWRYRDSLLAKYLLFGIAAGFTELLADSWLVQNTGTLVYITGGPFIISSPLYMPFAWANVLIYLGCIGYWFSERFGLAIACLLTAVIGVINIPLYEQWAKGANWWFYQHTPMLGNAPIYIILGEFILALAIPYLLHWLKKAHWGWCVGLGIIQGLWIWCAYALAFQVTG
ncbi:MAG TPA: hypothetical protein VK203_13740 [Nostocaceae cyanobacterium]|nr:hypothetical protein [Nostocaceae cyanobacterium]